MGKANIRLLQGVIVKADEKTEKTNIRLSQCMIVKNEEQNIERALSWGKDVVCEQIVVDTGSTDRTVELAQNMGAKVYHFAWNDDFSAAKNYAIEQASGDWIAFLDADEYFSKKDAKKLMDILERVNADLRIAFVRTKMAHLNQDGSIMGVTFHDRVFRNHANVRYCNRIHEVVQNCGDSELWMFDAQDELMILHTGYGTQVNRPQKAMRNINLLKKELEQSPRDGHVLQYLGDSYDMAGEKELALDCYRKVLWESEMDISDGFSLVESGLNLLRLRSNEPPEDTKDEYAKVMEKLRESGYGMHPDLDYYQGKWYLDSGQLEEAATLFESSLEKMEWQQFDNVTPIVANLESVNRVIAVVAFNRGEFQKAIRFVIPALRLNRYSSDSIQVLLASFRMEWKDGMDIEPYWDCLSELYDMKSQRDLLTLYRFAIEIPFRELAARIWKAFPKEVKEQLEQMKGSEHVK